MHTFFEAITIASAARHFRIDHIKHYFGISLIGISKQYFATVTVAHTAIFKNILLRYYLFLSFSPTNFHIL